MPVPVRGSLLLWVASLSVSGLVAWIVDGVCARRKDRFLGKLREVRYVVPMLCRRSTWLLLVSWLFGWIFLSRWMARYHVRVFGGEPLGWDLTWMNGNMRGISPKYPR